MRLLRYMLDEAGSRISNVSGKYLAQVMFTLVYWILGAFAFAEVFAFFDALDGADAVPSGVLAIALILFLVFVFIIYAFLLECLNKAKKRIAEENAELLDNIRNPK